MRLRYILGACRCIDHAILGICVREEENLRFNELVFTKYGEVYRPSETEDIASRVPN